MGSKIRIGTKYYKNLDHLMELVFTNQIKPRIVEDPGGKIGCYFCFGNINRRVLILRDSTSISGVDASAEHYLHEFCYDVMKYCFEKNLPYAFMRGIIVDGLRRRS